jgi:hypothetical protein
LFAHAASGFHEVVDAQIQANIEAGTGPSASAGEATLVSAERRGRKRVFFR